MPYRVGNIDPTWENAIDAAAATWSTAGAEFMLVRSASSSNVISTGPIESPNDQDLALTYTWTDVGGSLITRNTVIFNDLYDWDPAPIPDPNRYGVGNVMTHEFGHWVFLFDIRKQPCREVTMYWSADEGEYKKTTLHGADLEGLFWQYPPLP